MRLAQFSPLVIAIALSACGGSAEEEATEGDGSVSVEQAQAAASGAIKPTPGQYQTNLELLEFDSAGLPENMKKVARDAVESGFAQGNSFCLTPEEAENGPEQMVKNLAENDCTIRKFDVAGGTVDTDMSCTAPDGSKGDVKMAGTMTATTSEMIMDMDQAVPRLGSVHMKVKVNSRRVGECT
ncbi:conserved hypothetical protein [Altererythrobacter sp. B11]|uniref:DUF3617 domain-containing protein n=1 Tax=Altererythrobacter sp. B11 TaxID=2060312 RepID=UPI000DC70EC1|nr:DUF3617 domain-containing protein [Altererythrobacter sp. B11]BBC72240.1 conserved hypothetical protein [Altererythrobacter sp. B11]